jgi:hypothetical protein
MAQTAKPNSAIVGYSYRLTPILIDLSGFFLINTPSYEIDRHLSNSNLILGYQYHIKKGLFTLGLNSYTRLLTLYYFHGPLSGDLVVSTPENRLVFDVEPYVQHRTKISEKWAVIGRLGYSYSNLNTTKGQAAATMACSTIFDLMQQHSKPALLTKN